MKACKGLPLKDAIGACSWAKLDLLMDQGLDASELGSALLEHPELLPSEGFDLLSRCLVGGFAPTKEQVWFAALETEDSPRVLLLVFHEHLDINAPCPMEDRGHPLTLAQVMMLFSRQVWLDEWLDAGADFTTPLASGFSPATRLMLDVNADYSRWAAPIPASRVKVLLGLAQRNMVDWLDDDAFGVQPIQALRALPSSNNGSWKGLVSLAERQSLVQKMEASFPSCPVQLPRLSRSRF